MIRYLGRLPSNPIVACSGGPDSMAVLDFLYRGGKRKKLSVLNFHHGTDFSERGRELVVEYCNERNIDLILPKPFDNPPAGVSEEAYWHKKRYQYFHSLSEINYLSGEDLREIVTCHHLDDQVENWIMTSATGNPVLIPYRNENAGVVRPFLLSRKSDFISWCDRKCVPYLVDPSNSDTKYKRNFVRHKVVSVMLEVNPGLHKVIAKKVRAEYNEASR